MDQRSPRRAEFGWFAAGLLRPGRAIHPGPVPDVLTLRLSTGGDEPATTRAASGLAVAEAQPRQACPATERSIYAHKADRITVRHRHGKVVAVIEIVSPGNKGSTSEFRAFIEKSSALIQQGVNLLVIDLFPPTRRDPEGIHKAIWDEFEEEDFALPADKPLVLAAYRCRASHGRLCRARGRRRSVARHAAFPAGPSTTCRLPWKPRMRRAGGPSRRC